MFSPALSGLDVIRLQVNAKPTVKPPTSLPPPAKASGNKPAALQPATRRLAEQSG